MQGLKRIFSMVRILLGIALVGYVAFEFNNIKTAGQDDQAYAAIEVASLDNAGLQDVAGLSGGISGALPLSFAGCSATPMALDLSSLTHFAPLATTSGGAMQYSCSAGSAQVQLIPLGSAEKSSMQSALMELFGSDAEGEDRQAQIAQVTQSIATYPLFAKANGLDLHYDLGALKAQGFETPEASLAAGMPLPLIGVYGDQIGLQITSDLPAGMTEDLLGQIDTLHMSSFLVAPQEKAKEKGGIFAFLSFFSKEKDASASMEDGEMKYVSECKTVGDKKICSVVRADADEG